MATRFALSEDLPPINFDVPGNHKTFLMFLQRFEIYQFNLNFEKKYKP